MIQSVDPKTERKVNNRILEENKFIVGCEKYAPEGAENIGVGTARCVYEKDDKIIKIATEKRGIKQNRNAYQVSQEVKGTEYEDDMAMVNKINDEGTIITQEKVKPWRQDKDWLERSLGFESTEKELKSKMDKMEEETGIKCEEFSGRKDFTKNWGVKNGETVLLDLGECNVQ